MATQLMKQLIGWMTLINAKNNIATTFILVQPF